MHNGPEYSRRKDVHVLAAAKGTLTTRLNRVKVCRLTLYQYLFILEYNTAIKMLLVAEINKHNQITFFININSIVIILVMLRAILNAYALRILLV